MTSVTDLYSSL